MRFCASSWFKVRKGQFMFAKMTTLARLCRINGGFILAGFAIATVAQSGSLEFFRGLTKGEWTIKHRDGSPDLKICLKTGEELVQIKHRRTDCSRFVVEDGQSKVTVQYTCPGDGYGRTDIRRENSSLVQIESQGIAGGLPFQVAVEARRTGSC